MATAPRMVEDELGRNMPAVPTYGYYKFTFTDTAGTQAVTVPNVGCKVKATNACNVRFVPAETGSGTAATSADIEIAGGEWFDHPVEVTNISALVASGGSTEDTLQIVLYIAQDAS